MSRESLLSLYKRWRHTRGFGVHSPFAYRIVKEVVHPPRGYAYYAELRPGMDRIERIVYRLSVFLHNELLPQAMRIPPPTSPSEAAKRSNEIEIWSKTFPSPIFIERPVDAERDAIYTSLCSTNRGLFLSAPTYLLAIPRSEMAFVSYFLL